jgi:uncharacterized protein
MTATMRGRAGVPLWLLFAGTLSVFPAHAQELPAHVGKVNDFAEVLDASQRATLETELADLERATSAEVAVVTMDTLGGRTVEDYATDLFNTWGIGKKDRDNGVLILVAVQDRAMRIEVGYGLEGILPDGLAGAVIRETFLPRFRNDDYRTGLLEGTARVIAIVRRNETLTAAQRAAFDQAARDEGKTWGLTAFIGIFVGLGAFTLGTAAGAKVGAQLLFGLCLTGGALYSSQFMAPRAGVVTLVLLATGLAVLGFVLGRRPKWRRSIRGTSRGGSGWIADGDSSSDSSSSSGDSSGGSFGGGSSGGGGASGRW